MMMLRYVLLLIAFSYLPVAAQNTFRVENWEGDLGEVQVEETGPLSLGNVDPETNLALQKPAIDHTGDQVAITDGKTDRRSVWHPLTASAFNFFVQVDLEEPRLIDRVVVVPPDGNKTDFMKGYSIQTSIDNIVYIEQVLNSRNLEKLIDTTFTPVIARYVRVQVKAVDQVHDVQVAEVEVYGGGYLSSGTFTADVMDFGVSEPKNFGQVRWTAELPEGTEIQMQFRTGPTASPNGTWSDWTEAVDGNDGVLLDLPEPRRYLQYQVILSTEEATVTPRLLDMEVDYGEPLAESVVGEVVRDDVEVEVADTLAFDEAPVGVQRHFLFNLQADIGGRSGFDVVNLEFPNRSSIDKILINGDLLVQGSDYSLEENENEISIRFSEKILVESTIEVGFKSVLFDEQNVFSCNVVDLAFADNPQQIEASDNRDYALAIFGVGLLEKVFDKDRLVVAPNPFSPNNDGLFDVVRFQYELAKINILRPVKLRIFDLNGRAVRTIETMQKSGTHLVEWDGRDDDGDVIAPGLYLFQVDVDSGEKISFNGAIGVSY